MHLLSISHRAEAALTLRRMFLHTEFWPFSSLHVGGGQAALSPKWGWISGKRLDASLKYLRRESVFTWREKIKTPWLRKKMLPRIWQNHNGSQPRGELSWQFKHWKQKWNGQKRKESLVSTKGTKVYLFLEKRGHQSYAIKCLHRIWVIEPKRWYAYLGNIKMQIREVYLSNGINFEASNSSWMKLIIRIHYLK